MATPNQTKAPALPGNVATQAELVAQLEALKAENARLAAKAAGSGKLTLKVSTKGALSVYGMGRWPVTLYRGQWERLLDESTVKSIRAFIAANAGALAVKPGAEPGAE